MPRVFGQQETRTLVRVNWLSLMHVYESEKWNRVEL